MPKTQTRRRLLAGISGIGTAALLRAPLLAAEAALETTTVRLPNNESICGAPTYIVADLLRAEGFTDIRYVPLEPEINKTDAIARGVVDFGHNFGTVQIVDIDRGAPIKLLTGVHIGCFGLFAREEIRGVADLRGKQVGLAAVGTAEHLFLSLIAANVGIDPKAQIDWVTSGAVRPKQLFIDGKIDAFLGFPPDPQELRARGFSHVIVDSVVDRPWSQYFCCMLAGSTDYVENHPVAAKRVVRAVLKARISARASRRAPRAYSWMAALHRATTMRCRRSQSSHTTNGANTMPRTRSASTRCVCTNWVLSNRARRRLSPMARIGAS